MGLWPPASGNIINHDDRRCWATNPGIGRCVLLSGRGGGGTEVGNEDDCAIEVEGDGQVEILNRAERVAESLREGNASTASLI